MAKHIISIVTFCFLFFLIACKTKHADSSKTDDVNLLSNSTKTEGKVSHKYKSTGCETIIICKAENKEDTLFLIPTPSLEKFDVDGLNITFNYRILRVHNPRGCSQGIPAQISNISK